MGKSKVSQHLLLPHLTQEQRKNTKTPAKKLPIGSSPLSPLRKINRICEGSERNIALAKLIKKNDNGDTIESIKILARSMGRGPKHIILTEDIDKARTAEGHLKKRSHSEPILAAAIYESGQFNVDGEILDISGLELAYTASTNQPCFGDHQENCKDLAETVLSPMGFGNDYEGHKSADGFNELREDHDEKIKEGRGYASDPESDTEPVNNEPVKKRIIVVNSHGLAGRDFGLDKSPIPATDFTKFTPSYDS